MKEGQSAIYYVIGETRRGLEGAPHLEGLRKRGYEVLLMTDPVDEWTTETLSEFEGKPLLSAMRADLKIEGKSDEAKAAVTDADGLRALSERFRSVLGDRISEVRVSERLTDSPCCLVIATGGTHGYIERLLREAGREVPKVARILEINPGHTIVKNLKRLVDANDARVNEWIELLYDQALVAEGTPPADPNAFSRRVMSLLAVVSEPRAETAERAH